MVRKAWLSERDVALLQEMLDWYRQPEPLRGPRGRTPQTTHVVCMRVKTVSDDHLVCRTWDGTTEGTSDIKVAKPIDIRQSDWDGKTIGGISYASTGTQARTATGSTTESQTIYPPYVVDGAIYAATAISGGTGVTVDDEQLVFVDTNNSARHWISSCPT